jgi:hypothetical protein
MLPSHATFSLNIFLLNSYAYFSPFPSHLLLFHHRRQFVLISLPICTSFKSMVKLYKLLCLYIYLKCSQSDDSSGATCDLYSGGTHVKWGRLGFFIIFSREMPRYYFKLCHDVFHPTPSQLTIY